MEVGGAALESTRAVLEELCGRDSTYKGWKHEGVFCDVERKEWIDAVDEIVGAVASRALDSDAFGQENKWGVLYPSTGVFSRVFDVVHAHKGFANVTVSAFDEVRAGVVRGDPDRIHLETLEAGCELARKGGTVVVDYLKYRTPTAVNVFENELCHGLATVGSESAVFRISGK